MIQTIWDEKLQRNFIICFICKKPIKRTAYSNGGGYKCEKCEFRDKGKQS